MTFTVLNADEATTYPGQAQLDRVDLQIIAGALIGNGVVTGCAVTSSGTGNATVAVAVGEVKIGEVVVTVPATNIQLPANATGFARYDLITVPIGGTPVRTAGTAAAVPKFPNIPASSVVLAAVIVPNGHTLTSTIAAAQIVDKSIAVPKTFISTAEHDLLFTVRNGDLPGFVVKGGPAPTGPPQNMMEVLDGFGAPIFWVRSVGGIDCTDDIQTDYTVMGPTNWRVDVYGYQWTGTRCMYTFGGPPGNMLTYEDACHEVYQYTRMASLGTWTSVASTSSFTAVDLGAPPNSPTTYRAALQFTNSGAGSVWIATAGGINAYSGVTPGDLVASVFYMRSVSAAAARNANVRITWLTSAGATVGSDITSGAVSIPNTGVWTKVGMVGQVAPATAARVQMSILLGSSSGEIHQVCGAGLMKGSNEAIFAPPFIGNGRPDGLKREYGALAGDRWIRTDAPDTPGMREYVCRIGGQPWVQQWAPLDASDVRRLFYDQVNSTTTLADVYGWTVTVVSGREATIDIAGTLTSAALTTGWQFTWAAAGGATFSQFISVIEYQSSATAWTTNTINAVGAHALVTAAYATPTQIMFRLRCQFVPSASGTLAFRFASEVAASAITIKRGSIMTIT